MNPPRRGWQTLTAWLLVISLIALSVSTAVTLWVIDGISGLTYTMLFFAI